MARVKTEKELANAISNGADFIEIEGDLAKKTIRIRAVGKVAWAIAFSAIGIAVYATITTVGTGGTAAPATAPTSAFAAASAISILGVSTTMTAITIAVSAGGVAVLTSIRNEYKEVSRSDNLLVLKKK